MKVKEKKIKYAPSIIASEVSSSRALIRCVSLTSPQARPPPPLTLTRTYLIGASRERLNLIGGRGAGQAGFAILM